MAQYTLTDPKDLVVVVTGTSTGFGAGIVSDLYELGGYTIYATCTTLEGVKAYQDRNSPRLRPVKVDVTKKEDINRLRAQIEAECPQGIYCVVNNAGVNAGGWFDMTTEDTFERLMDVNYMGLVRVAKALVPSLRTFAKSRHTLANGPTLPRARFVAMSSVSGRINPLGLGPYAASKHAAESILDTLRVELAPWEIDVSMIEPGYAKTPLLTKALLAIEQDWQQADEHVHRMYGDQFIERVVQDQRHIYEVAMPAQWTVQATVDAVHKRDGAQKPRVLVGVFRMRVLLPLLEKLPEWVTDWMTLSWMKKAGYWPVDPFLLKDATTTNYTQTDPKTLVVVVTGTSTGFGAGIVSDLHKLGLYTIYATCSTHETLKYYKDNESTRLRPVKVDVTKQDDVTRLRVQIEAECPQGVYCVINNAGINAGCYIDMTTEATFERLMNVNYMGLVRVTKALLPSLRTFAKSRHTLPQGKDLPRARLIGMSSIAGRINSIGLGPYSASKHAVESILDTLRVELSPWEIDVSIIEPGYAKTPIITKAISALEKEWEQADVSIRQMYGQKFIETVIGDQRKIYENAMPAEWTVRATVDAVHKKDGAQKSRVLIDFWVARLFLRLLEKLPESVTDSMYRAGMKKAGYWPADPFLLKGDKRD
ncbi:Dehydrogenase/reductase SDR member 9 [Mortierella sp. 14UC]|nr:Dehydrogenase/reductase SDR member 9 [Mortierella sp. 14UC]